jgi:hypothetical protein
MERSHPLFQDEVSFYDLATAGVIDFAFRSQREGAFRAIDQLRAQVPLQLINHLTGPRLRNAVLLGGARKTAPADDIAKHFEGLKVHTQPEN